MTNTIVRALVLVSALVAGMIAAPVVAEDYYICLAEERSDWPVFGVPLRKFEAFHVVPDADDKEDRLLQAIIEGVQNEGLTATFGSLQDVPDGSDIIITFEAHWTWDFGDKLHESIIFFRDVKTMRVLLVASHFGHGLASMPTVEIARMVNRLNSPDLATPLCWSEKPYEEKPNKDEPIA